MSSDKLALCHLELTRKLHDLLKDVLRYGEEQLKAHKKVAAALAGMWGPGALRTPDGPVHPLAAYECAWMKLGKRA